MGALGQVGVGMVTLPAETVVQYVMATIAALFMSTNTATNAAIVNSTTDVEAGCNLQSGVNSQHAATGGIAAAMRAQDGKRVVRRVVPTCPARILVRPINLKRIAHLHQRKARKGGAIIPRGEEIVRAIDANDVGKEKLPRSPPKIQRSGSPRPVGGDVGKCSSASGSAAWSDSQNSARPFQPRGEVQQFP